MNILIIEIKSGKHVGTYDIYYNGSEQQHFDEAWKCLIEDRIATSDCRKDFSFHLLE